MEEVVITYSIDSFASSTHKRDKFNEITAAICALLNTHGGRVKMCIYSRDKPGTDSFSSLIRTIEQTMISIIGVNRTVRNINFEENEKSIVISVQKAGSFITTNYNLHLPSQTQIIQVPPTDPLKTIVENIITRELILQEVPLNSHQDMFVKDKMCGFQESKMAQFKCLKSDPSSRTTLADRIISKGNKFNCYVSGFANYNGGHIYYGINDHRVVEGEIISEEKDKSDITKKVKKALGKLIWPIQIGQPTRGVHWDIFFEPVRDAELIPITSLFAIVIYIAPCLGGVFIEEPECYEMVEGEVTKMSFITWKKKALNSVGVSDKDQSIARGSDSTKPLCAELFKFHVGH